MKMSGTPAIMTGAQKLRMIGGTNSTTARNGRTVAASRTPCVSASNSSISSLGKPPHAGDHLGIGEWLGYEGAGAQGLGRFAVVGLSLRGKHDDRQAREIASVGADGTQNVEPVHARQHDVEHDCRKALPS